MERKKEKNVAKALRAQYFLIAYNVLEAVASLFFGAAANSIALFGFGLDSVVESLSTVIVALHLRENCKDSCKEEEARERRALRLVGYCFVLLAAYVLFESARKLFSREAPEATPFGVLIAAASIIVMPFFAKYRHDLGHEIKSKALVADSKQTRLCVYMSAALLAGVALNYFFGLWWADPLAGIFIAFLAALEGKKALEGKTCCCS